MKKLLRLSSFLILMLSFSCEEQGWFVNCSDCVSEEPEQAEVNLKLTNIEASVQVLVYDGEIEDNVIYKSVEAFDTKYSIWVSLNKLYTFTARYVINGNVYIAVDSATPRVKYTKDECDDPCYFIYDKGVDLRLKYRASGD